MVEPQESKNGEYDLQAFLARIDQLLFTRGWTKRDLAMRAGINTNTLHNYWRKSPKGFPKLDIAYRIAEALQVHIDYLMKGAQDSEEPDTTTEHFQHVWNRLSGKNRYAVLTEAILRLDEQEGANRFAESVVQSYLAAERWRVDKSPASGSDDSTT